MQLIDYHQLIMQGMLHLNEMTRFDIVWYSKTYEKIHAFINHPIPAGLDFQIHEEFPSITSLCYQQGVLKYCLASTYSELEFIFIPLSFKEKRLGLIRIGPFLTSHKDDQMISHLMLTLELPLLKRQILRNFYDSLQLVPGHYSYNIGYIGMNLFGHTMPYIQATAYHSTSAASEIYQSPTERELPQTLEERYAFEKELRKAVVNGDKETIKKITHYFEHKSLIKDRFPDNPLRSAKNLAIVLNTLLRQFAEEGGLHPVYLHQLSTKFAILIEHATTRTKIRQLQVDMINAYTEAVKKYAFAHVSPFIRKVIDTIQLNLDQPLSVSSLAQRFKMKPSNLANQFKHEMHCTVSDFVNQRRIREACHYLKTTDFPISDISHMVGINDANYFSRLFKHYKQMTPLQYRRS